MIAPYKGSFHVEYFAKTASTAFAFGDMVTVLSTAAGDGLLIKATATSTAILGTIQKTVASTDSDYASNTMVPVLVGDADAVWLCDVSTGTAATTDIGEWIDIDDENSVDVNAYTLGVMQVVGIVSTTKVLAKIAKKNGKELPITA